MNQTIADSGSSFLAGLARPGRSWFSSIDVTEMLRGLTLPLVGIAVFLMIWQFAANRIDTSLGQFPGPVQVWEQVKGLAEEHQRILRQRAGVL